MFRGTPLSASRTVPHHDVSLFTRPTYVHIVRTVCTTSARLPSAATYYVHEMGVFVYNISSCACIPGTAIEARFDDYYDYCIQTECVRIYHTLRDLGECLISPPP